jgi:hypothetical protein
MRISRLEAQVNKLMNKIAVGTGGNSGIGLAAVMTFVAEGPKLSSSAGVPARSLNSAPAPRGWLATSPILPLMIVPLLMLTRLAVFYRLMQRSDQTHHEARRWLERASAPRRNLI